jgi:hypothetical protein
MLRRFSRCFLGLSVVGFLLLLTPSAANAQVVVKVNDTVNFRFGLQLQSWAEWLQDPNSEGYSQNLFIRRIRTQILGTFAPGVMVFYQTDNPRVGNAGTDGNKNVNTGFQTQDAVAVWKFCGDYSQLYGGLWLVPGSRNDLTSTASFLSFDIGQYAIQGNGIMKGTGGRDYGFGVLGWLLDDKLEYRTGIFQGNRNPASPQLGTPLGPEAGSRNSFRIAGRVNYDFLDSEKQTFTYTYAGTNRGTKSVIAVGGWGDGQDSYKAYGGDFIVDLPIAKDAVTFEFDYNHYEGGSNFPSLGKQNDIFANAGYYFDVVKLQPYVLYQELNFSDDVNKPKNQKRYGGGLNWYVYGNNLKFSVIYERIVPKTQPITASTKDTNRFAVQLQALYF